MLYFFIIVIIIYALLYDIYNLNDIRYCMKKYNTDEIYEFPNLLNENECDKVIELSKNKIERSKVMGETDEISEIRTSHNTFLDDNLDPLLNDLNQRINKLTNIDTAKYEDLQVVHYDKKQFYKEHWDACDPKEDDNCIRDYSRGGMRFATFIIYLNDDMEGGETNFPLINKKIKPEKGKGVLFFNLDDDLLHIKQNSKHAGLPPSSGEKWMCNKWIRLYDFK